MYLGSDVAPAEQIEALMEFVAWCSSSQGNQAKTISGKLASVQYFHRVQIQQEIPTGAAQVNRALKGVEKAHVADGTKKR